MPYDHLDVTTNALNEDSFRHSQNPVFNMD